MTLIQVIETDLDDAGSRVVKFYKFGKNVHSAKQAAPFGVDSNPIEGMIAIHTNTSVDGKPAVIGYINPDQVAEVGEMRIFSTDSDGELQTYIHLKNDGTMEIGGNTKHMTRFEELKVGFDQLRTDFNAHVHAGNGVPPTTPSTASIDDSKIDEIKTLAKQV